VGDEDRGWLDDFAKVAALLDSGPAWERALTLSEGKADLAAEQERHAPGDALRWATYAGTTPEQAERGFLRPLWRLVVSLLDPSEPGDMPSRRATGELLDEWMAARLYHAVAAVTRALDKREPGRAAGELAALVDDWAGWYAPRRPGVGCELVEPLTRLLAPFTPHLAEAIHRQRGKRARPSVHLEDWPVLDPAWENESLLKNMARVRHLAALGLRARVQVGIQPDELLPGALVGSLAGATWSRADLEPFAALLADSLRVARVELSADAAGRVEWRLSLDPERPVQRDVSQPAIAAALAALSAERAAQSAAQLQQGISVGLEVSEQAITLLPDEVTVSVRPRAGWAAAADDEHLVALVVG
jgi:isoleucyl-tRNA synthetase